MEGGVDGEHVLEDKQEAGEEVGNAVGVVRVEGGTKDRMGSWSAFSLERVRQSD